MWIWVHHLVVSFFASSLQVGPNVHLLPWVPQNDLLAHPKLVLFITHCGYNSLIESVSHGKPMIGFPISLDQPYNAAIMKDKGLAEMLSLADFTAGELTSTIEKVISDPKYKENAQRASRLLRDKSQPPGERISYWANHVVQYGNAHMLSAAHDLNIFQFLMIDIYLFLFTCGLVVIAMMVGCAYCSCRCVRRCCGGSGKTKTHVDWIVTEP